MSKASSRIPTFRPKATPAPQIQRKSQCEDGIQSSGPYSMLFFEKKSDTYKLNNTFTSNSESNVLKNADEYDSNDAKSLIEGGSNKRRRTFQLDDLHRKTSLSLLINNCTASSGNESKDFEEVLLKKLQSSSTCVSNNTGGDEDGSKRDSLEFDESLGILTPEQMDDGLSFVSVVNFKALSSECLPINDSVWKQPSSKSNMNSPNAENRAELLSPNVPDGTTTSNTDFSLGLIDEQLLSNLTLRTDTTMNMELPLDTMDNNRTLLTRSDQTPSPEDLPLDPTPVVDNNKIEISNNKSSKSIITSITSITSLDTGYQGDGEMSRPASRNADSSPLTRRPLARPQTRRNDPMTDSDFYTESDADNHEENPLRGDRKAQVIDGTLYGVDPQAAADIYVNNRENMDSSGIFTDIESNPRTEEDLNPIVVNPTLDVSPSDTSTKTISGNSQNNVKEIVENDKSELSENNNNNNSKEQNPKKRTAPSPVASSPSSERSPRHHHRHSSNKEDAVTSAKKYKMPKREVASKVKAMLETNTNIVNNNKEKKTVKKPAGRWDAVMNKISKSEQISKTNLKEVKSKIFSSVGSPTQNQRQSDVRNKTSTRLIHNQNAKPRRIRARLTPSGNSSKKTNVQSSVHSSLSDLSAAGAPPKTNTGSVKNHNKRDVVQVTQVLTASKLPSNNRNNNGSSNPPEVKKISSKKLPLLPTTKQHQIQQHQIQQQNSNKECGRATVKGGRTSPVVRPPAHTRTPSSKPAPKVAEALAILVQHLVFNVEAYQVPNLKRDVEKFRNEADEFRLACRQLEETLSKEKTEQMIAVEEMRTKYSNEIVEIQEEHRNQIAELNCQLYELERSLTEQHEANRVEVSKQNDENLLKLKLEFDKLQKTHQESLDILREENDSIREQIDEKNAQLDEMQQENAKLKEQHVNVSKENQKLRLEMVKMEDKIKERIQGVYDENQRLRDDNDRMLSYNDTNGVGVQEVQSLRVVLELKQNEVAELRRNLAESVQRIEMLSSAEEKSAFLTARCEDLELQLERKSEYEQGLIAENKKLHESFKEEANQKKRLLQHNEELQWKLKQNKEVAEKVLEQAVEESVFNRNALSSSFNERHHSTPKHNFERTFSFRESATNVAKKRNGSRCDFKEEDEESPPMSPKVKGVVEKSEWVSYMLDLEESPDIVASRIVRRSFRNLTPPKTTPTKSPCNKRARMKNPLCPSVSASAILPSGHAEYSRSRSLSTRSNCSWDSSSSGDTKKLDHLDLEDDDDCDDHEVDLPLPALPSEIGRNKSNGARALPSPKHLAGEAMISESNSEDESTSSSSVQL